MPEQSQNQALIEKLADVVGELWAEKNVDVVRAVLRALAEADEFPYLMRLAGGEQRQSGQGADSIFRTMIDALLADEEKQG